ncbi:hypothetical protein ABQ359_22235 [Serratia fonticola]|uniref:hypothetical protein n=1 Tax=Serratia fonticola TaxID=47917 RepID=UPI003AAD8BFE
MKERPVLFNGDMVRAILDGRKTQTRRMVKPQREGPVWSAKPAQNPRYERHTHDWWLPTGTKPYSALPPCPYGAVGDRIWVRETFMDLTGTGIEAITGQFEGYAYRADTPPGSLGDETRKEYKLKWTPSLHMPRSACRLVLEITGVRVERLNDISNDDAKAEGYPAEREADGGSCDPWLWFRDLWDGIYPEQTFKDNPWVWVIEFKRVEAHHEE